MADPPTYSDPTQQPGYGYDQRPEHNEDLEREIQPPAYTPPQQPYGHPQQPCRPPQQPYGHPQQPCGPPPQSYGQPQQGYGLPPQGFVQQPIPTPGFGQSVHNTVVVSQPSVTPVIITHAIKPPTYLGLAIVTCVFCSPLFGLIAIIFSVMSENAYGDGNVAEARSHGRISMWLSLAGAIISIIVVVVVVAITQSQLKGLETGY